MSPASGEGITWTPGAMDGMIRMISVLHLLPDDSDCNFITTSLDLTERSVGNCRGWLQLLHFSCKPLSPEDVFPSPIPIAVAQSFYGTDESPRRDGLLKQNMPSYCPQAVLPRIRTRHDFSNELRTLSLPASQGAMLEALSSGDPQLMEVSVGDPNNCKHFLFKGSVCDLAQCFLCGGQALSCCYQGSG